MTKSQSRQLLVLLAAAVPLLLGAIAGTVQRLAPQQLGDLSPYARLPIAALGPMLTVYVGLGRGRAPLRLLLAAAVLLMAPLCFSAGLEVIRNSFDYWIFTLQGRLPNIFLSPWGMNQALTGGLLILFRPWFGVVAFGEESPEPREVGLRTVDLLTASAVAAVLLSWQQAAMQSGAFTIGLSQLLLIGAPYYLFQFAVALGAALAAFSFEWRLAGAALCVAGMLGSVAIIAMQMGWANLPLLRLEFYLNQLAPLLAIALLCLIRGLGWRLRLPEGACSVPAGDEGAGAPIA
ncbi:hypothetical protein Mal64_39040 [Pseudobythopirellula maris]|uniref:Uncharacterized protein n=1 Tax=Pseudobythopirellula maris TaxID=2527991 RepID=A0A5C5ZFK7_9BACT|nr:hypothetical protein [Pseudobythopirellula maris]TWT86164.1 hypothetical protein Mal64_39040 [Pseudobythopirellula maris]